MPMQGLEEKKPMKHPLLKLDVDWDEIGKAVGLKPEEIPPPKDPEEAPGRPEIIKIECKDGPKVEIPADMLARPQTLYFEEDLSLYGTPEDIIRVHRDRPDLLRARKSTPQCDGKCETCDSGSGDSCKSKKES